MPTLYEKKIIAGVKLSGEVSRRGIREHVKIVKWAMAVLVLVIFAGIATSCPLLARELPVALSWVLCVSLPIIGLAVGVVAVKQVKEIENYCKD